MKDPFQLAVGSDANVLITGPTGSGKTFLAEQIHGASSRAGKPFVCINLATLHEGTLESELFGHERGTFTGADQRKIGRLESAEGGTVFLDEIGELSPRLQCRLLDFIQNKTVTRMGSGTSTRLDVRIIAATHVDLEMAVKRGLFREDLFHRIRVLAIRMPSLLERLSELDGIVHRILDEVCDVHRRKVLRISAGVAEALEAYPWPGNLRELRNVLEYAVISAEEGEIRVCDLPSWFRWGKSPLQAAPAAEQSVVDGQAMGSVKVPLSFDYRASLERFEAIFFRWALNRNSGQIEKTARSLGISKATLSRRMHEFGIRREVLQAAEYAPLEAEIVP